MSPQDGQNCHEWCQNWFGNAGRAGLLGMAISLVSTVPERVWYVKAKGYKPWLNPKPQDTKDNDEGGHTIWYNEPDLLKVLLPALEWPQHLHQ